MKERTFAALAALCLLVGLCLPAAALEPAKEFYVADYAGVLEAEREAYYIRQGAALEEATQAQIVVATVPSLEGHAVEEYANALYNDWGIGGREASNGLLILLSTGERKIRVEVGKGLEGAINDARAGRYIDQYAIPSLAQDRYDEGIYNLYNALLPAVYGEYGLEVPEDVPQTRERGDGQEEKNKDYASTLMLVIVVVLFLMFFGGGPRGRYGRRRYFGGPFIGGGIGGVGRHHGGVGRHHGGFGGGGHSGGGGRSAGGGASRGF